MQCMRRSDYHWISETGALMPVLSLRVRARNRDFSNSFFDFHPRFAQISIVPRPSLIVMPGWPRCLQPPLVYPLHDRPARRYASDSCFLNYQGTGALRHELKLRIQ
jgi:hypothetical protein